LLSDSFHSEILFFIESSTAVHSVDLISTEAPAATVFEYHREENKEKGQTEVFQNCAGNYYILYVMDSHFVSSFP